MNCIILMSEWCNKKLQLPAGLFLSHSTLINISQPARMVCYLNLMNFCTEWNASNWQSVIKQNRREYKSPENRKERTNKRAEREGKKRIPWHTVHGGAGVNRKIREKQVFVGGQRGRLLPAVLDQWHQCCFSFYCRYKLKTKQRKVSVKKQSTGNSQADR